MTLRLPFSSLMRTADCLGPSISIHPHPCVMRKSLFVFVALAFLGTACREPSVTELPRLELSFEPLALATAPESGEPNLAVRADGVVYASWIDPLEAGGHALRFAVYDPEDVSWSSPQTIAQGDDWFVNWADVPSMAAGADGHLAAHWLARNGESTYAYGVLESRSTDEGKTWSTPQWMHEDTAAVEHGFASMTPMDGGDVMAVWLDGWKYVTDEPGMTLRARILRADGTQAPEVELDDLTCDCCPNATAPLPGGGVLAVYRDRSPDEIRDIYSVRFIDGAWGTPRRLAADGWHIQGCPVNGPAVDTDAERAVVAWFTAAGDTAQVKMAFSEDAAATFGEPIRVDLGNPVGRVDAVLLADGSAFVTWIERGGAEEDAGILTRRVHPDGRMSEAVTVEATSTARASGYPRMVKTGNDLVFAWTRVSPEKQVVTAVARF